MRDIEEYIFWRLNECRYPVLTMHQQAEAIEFHHPRFRAISAGDGLRAWGALQPKPICRDYLVEIHYELGMRPQIFILQPKLKVPADYSKVPHVYADDDLCVFMPGRGEWDPSKPIATTIVPWISLWLFYYELWCVTGEWLGGGEHPNSRTTKRTLRRQSKRQLLRWSHDRRSVYEHI